VIADRTAPRSAPVGEPRDAIGEVQRARILAGAIEAVAQHGYAGLTVAEIIAPVKISRRTFYELFADREECFLAAFDAVLVRVEEPVAEAYASASSWQERIRAALAALLAFLDQQPALARLLVVDALAAGPAVLARRARVLDVLVRAVDEGRGEAEGRRDPGLLVAEGVVGAVLGVLHARLLDQERQRTAPPMPQPPLSALVGPLMGMIVLPYLGIDAAERERVRPARRSKRGAASARRRLEANPLHGLNMRLTYRTLCVLRVVAEQPHASNRGVAERAGIADQGQTSKLLARLQGLGLIENTGDGHASGEPNAWTLTARGAEVVDAFCDRPAVR
jgi:AcrR family transcriptional regulator